MSKEDLNDVPDVIYIRPVSARYLAQPGMAHESVVPYIDKRIHDRMVAALQERINERP